MKSQSAIKRALAYLEGSQLPSGGFTSSSLATKFAKDATATYETTFFPSLILSALSRLDGSNAKTAQPIINGLKTFLKGQASSNWSYNYWNRQSSAYKQKPYPDDLDDTFCALSALSLHDENYMSPQVMASAAKMLIQNEIEPGGPYKTWLVSGNKPKWSDVDIAVNANISYFLSLQNVELENLTNYIEAAIIGDTLRSAYYPNIYPICYFVARWYHGALANQLAERIWSRRQGAGWRHPQRTALAISSLLRLGFEPNRLRPAVEYLLHLQADDGGWDAEAFCIDPSIDGKKHYGSSRGLATALCIEALSEFQRRTKAKAVQHDGTTDTFYMQVSRAVTDEISYIPRSDLRAQLSVIQASILEQDEDRQIILLPLLTAKTFNIDADRQLITRLAKASMWGWMAYTTYDDILDAEADVGLLPAANVCLRNLVRELGIIMPQNTAFQDTVKSILDRIDGANSWEMVHCRAQNNGGKLAILELPDYGNLWQLADRSLGHIISALGVLYSAGFAADSVEIRATQKYFYHYLIARQLNDDAHDWFEDLSRGHINAVATRLLARLHCSNKPLKFEPKRLHADLQKIMWQEVIVEVCDAVAKHVNQARKELAKLNNTYDLRAFEKLLEPIQSSAKTALSKREESLALIAQLYN